MLSKKTYCISQGATITRVQHCMGEGGSKNTGFFVSQIRKIRTIIWAVPTLFALDFSISFPIGDQLNFKHLLKLLWSKTHGRVKRPSSWKNSKLTHISRKWSDSFAFMYIQGAFLWENRLYFVGTKFFICLYVHLGCVFVGKSVTFRVNQVIHLLISTFRVSFLEREGLRETLGTTLLQRVGKLSNI